MNMYTRITKLIGFGSCLTSNIALSLNSNSSIICSGADSCKESTITSINTAYCHGLESCVSSDITNVQILYMLGSKSGINSNIVSSPNDDNITFYFYGLQSGLNTTINCIENSTCYIYSTAIATHKALNTYLICQGTCVISCYSPYENAINCFNVRLTNDTSSQVRYITDSPTRAPTMIPTTDPTTHPTSMPTIAFSIVEDLQCTVESDDITGDNGCLLDTDDEVEQCCKFEHRYVLFFCFFFCERFCFHMAIDHNSATG